ncbi:MAG: hypothetical protein O2887_10285 [Bacteroidetes bacterium]|nr:hypothetical protein [Bacteroidota bacterium]
MMGLIQDALNKFGDDTVRLIQGNLSSTNTNASGQTSNSLKSEVTGERLTVTGKPFIYVVETGRKAGKMPPVSVIREWLESGKVSFTGKIESVAWAIAKTIAKSGSSLFRKGGRDDIITPAVSESRIDELTKVIADIEFEKTIVAVETGI